MNLELTNLKWFVGATLTIALNAGCGTERILGDNPEVGGTDGQGGANTNTGGKADTGGKANTGGLANTGGKTSAPSTTVATGGASRLPDLPKACPGLPLDTATTDDAGVCTGEGKELEPSPLDMLIMMDRTMSMTYCLDGRHDECIPDTAAEPMRWEILQQSVQQFLANMGATMPAIRQPRLGLGYFGATGNPEDPSECLASTYANPGVNPIIPMQQFATGSTAILDWMQAELAGSNGISYLGGQTPWQPSLHGALQYAQAWQKNNMNRVTVVLFVTDGYPTECDVNMNNILETVGEYFAGVQGIYNTVGMPNIRTFIMGVGGDLATNRYNLDNAAQAGGTGTATIADNVSSVNAFAEAMSNISNAKIDCDFALPPPPQNQILDTTKVQVIYDPFKGDPQEMPMATSAGGCSTANGGWYFDSPTAPTKITLCPCSCANLGAGSIAVKFGCRPKPAIN